MLDSNVVSKDTAAAQLARQDDEFMWQQYRVRHEASPRLPVVYRRKMLGYGRRSVQDVLPAKDINSDDFWQWKFGKDWKEDREPLLRGQRYHNRNDPVVKTPLDVPLGYTFQPCDKSDQPYGTEDDQLMYRSPIRSCPISGCDAMHHIKCCFSTYERALIIRSLPAQSIPWEKHVVEHKTCSPNEMRSPNTRRKLRSWMLPSVAAACPSPLYVAARPEKRKYVEEEKAKDDEVVEVDRGHETKESDIHEQVRIEASLRLSAAKAMAKHHMRMQCDAYSVALLPSHSSGKDEKQPHKKPRTLPPVPLFITNVRSGGLDVLVDAAVACTLF
jgi:hypothetical protein